MYHFKPSVMVFLIFSLLSMILTGCNHPSSSDSPHPTSTLNHEQNIPAADPSMEPIEQEQLPKINIEIPASVTLAPRETYPLPIKIVTSEDSTTYESIDGIRYHSDTPEVAAVNALGEITVTEKAANGATAKITAEFEGVRAETVVTVQRLKPNKDIKNETAQTTDTIPVVANADSIDVMVNKQRRLPADYVPPDLVEPNIPFSFEGKSEKKWMRKEAAEALERLFAKAEQDEMILKAVSGYRSYARQKSIFDNNVKIQGEQQARRYSAYPGTSEHQTGLAMDVSSSSASYALDESFGNTKEGQWLAEHAPTFGFIIRYPKDKEHITGYAYEPWHLRYVGEEIAAHISGKGMTLEEFFGESIPVSGSEP